MDLRGAAGAKAQAGLFELEADRGQALDVPVVQVGGQPPVLALLQLVEAAEEPAALSSARRRSVMSWSTPTTRTTRPVSSTTPSPRPRTVRTVPSGQTIRCSTLTGVGSVRSFCWTCLIISASAGWTRAMTSSAVSSVPVGMLRMRCIPSENEARSVAGSHSQLPIWATRCASASWRWLARTIRSERRSSVTSLAIIMPAVTVPPWSRRGTKSSSHTVPGLRRPGSSMRLRSPASAARQRSASVSAWPGAANSGSRRPASSAGSNPLARMAPPVATRMRRSWSKPTMPRSGRCSVSSRWPASPASTVLAASSPTENLPVAQERHQTTIAARGRQDGVAGGCLAVAG